MTRNQCIAMGHCVVLFALLVMPSRESSAITIHRANAEMKAADLPTTPYLDRVGAVERIYATRIDVGLHEPAMLSTADLLAAFEATDRVAVYATTAATERLPHYLDRMTALVDELAARDLATKQHMEATFDTMLAMRLFEQAARFKLRFAAHLGDRFVPVVTWAPGFDADAPAVMALQEEGSLLARNVDRSGAHLVVVAGCRPSQRAIKEINALPELVEALDRIPVSWLVPADRMTDPEFLREWNARFPRQPAMFAYANAAWKGVEFQSMPRFQRFEGEQRIAQLLGWKRGGGAAQLEPLL